jgi:acetyl-CoA carboxylase carboxyltransferase component
VSCKRNTNNPTETDSFLPIVPTVAAINGHCFAAGFMTSLACDYRVMTDGAKRRAWMCMNEVRSYLYLKPILS